MEMRQIGSTDIRVTSVAMGCWPITGISSVNVTEDSSKATLQAAFDSGINFFDSAYVYGYDGESEKMIAAVLGAQRDQIVIATKGGIQWRDGKIHRDGRAETIRRQCEESLQRLRTDVIDLYYLHSPDPDLPVSESAMAFAELRASGKIRSVGVSNLTLSQLKEFLSLIHI